MPLDGFPPTLRDAVVITRHLGLRYLWVDALCILQDCTDDWLVEASKMRDVYKGARVTIAAARAQSLDEGIFSLREEPGDSCDIPWYTSKTSSSPSNSTKAKVSMRRYSDDLAEEDPGRWPLSDRGWTLQEDKLSWRTITYGRHRMSWKCPSLQVDEGGHIIKAPHHKAKRFFPPDPTKSPNLKSAKWAPPSLDLVSRQKSPGLDAAVLTDSFYLESDLYPQWYTLVAEFTDRLLTVRTDVLPALSGLAAEFSRLTGDTYCAGLWKRDIICGLLWNREEHPRPYKWGDDIYKGPAEAPSWSWAGVHGGRTSWFHNEAIMMTELAEDLKSAREIAKVHHVDIKTVALDPFGQVLRGALTIEAPFFQLLEAPFYSLYDSAMWNHGATPFERMLRRRLTFANDELTRYHLGHPSQRYGLLQMMLNTKLRLQMQFLLVESTGNGTDEYRRLRWVTIDGGRAKKEDHDVYGEERAAVKQVIKASWPLKTIVLV